MQPPPTSRPAAAGGVGFRDPLAELAVLGTTLVAVGVLVPEPLAFVVAVLAAASVALGAVAVLGPGGTGHAALVASVVPAVTTGAAILAGRLVAPGLLLVPAVGAAAGLLVAALGVERRIPGRVHGPTAGDRSVVRAVALVTAALAFAGIAAGLPGALVEPVSGAGGGEPVPAEAVALLAVGDASIAALLGYRLTALRGIAGREVALAALSYALVIGIGAAALRAMAIPRLLGPALLVLVLYLWDAYRGAPRGARRDVRALWEIGLLLLVGIVVVAWNVLSRG